MRPRRRRIVVHEVDNLHRVVAITDFRYSKDDRLVLEVNPCSGIEGVVVGRATGQMGRHPPASGLIEAVRPGDRPAHFASTSLRPCTTTGRRRCRPARPACRRSVRASQRVGFHWDTPSLCRRARSGRRQTRATKRRSLDFTSITLRCRWRDRLWTNQVSAVKSRGVFVALGPCNGSRGCVSKLPDFRPESTTRIGRRLCFLRSFHLPNSCRIFHELRRWSTRINLIIARPQRFPERTSAGGSHG